MILEGTLVRLRPMLRRDAADCLRWLRNPEVNPAGARWTISPAEEQAWVENRLDAPEGYFEIETLDGTHIGNASLSGFSAHDRAAELSIHIGEQPFWGKGYGTDAMQLLLRYGFETRGLHRIELHVRASNTRAIRLYEQLGFVREGTAREAFFFNGAFEDEYQMSMLETEWRQR